MKNNFLILFIILILSAVSCLENITNPTESTNKDGSVKLFLAKGSGKKINELGNYSYKIVLLGDGFTEEDNVQGGAFDTGVEKIINALFEVEPFKTYKAHFEVWQIYVNSKERGASDPKNGEIKDTVFKSYYYEKNERLLMQNTALIDAK